MNKILDIESANEVKTTNNIIKNTPKNRFLFADNLILSDSGSNDCNYVLSILFYCFINLKNYN